MLFSWFLLFAALVSSYEICCPLFQVSNDMLEFLHLSVKHENKWIKAGYIPNVYKDILPDGTKFVRVPVDQETAYFFFNSPNNYTKCYDCARLSPNQFQISDTEKDRLQWMSTYAKFTQHDSNECHNQLDKQNWTTGYIVAAVVFVLFILFVATAVVSWVSVNIKRT
jgi:hypothetical protein